jgi:hypothetical protein
MHKGNDMRYEVKTTFNESQISQTLLKHDHLNETSESIRRKIINIEEEGVRKALIELGWTPPKTK